MVDFSSTILLSSLYLFVFHSSPSFLAFFCITLYSILIYLLTFMASSFCVLMLEITEYIHNLSQPQSYYIASLKIEKPCNHIELFFPSAHTPSPQNFMLQLSYMSQLHSFKTSPYIIVLAVSNHTYFKELRGEKYFMLT